MQAHARSQFWSSASMASTLRNRIGLAILGTILVLWYLLSSDYSPVTVSPVQWLTSHAPTTSSPWARRVKLEHPIPRLMEEADISYRKKLGRQSNTLRRAVAEYRKRYKRYPPKGFDEWFQFAKEHSFKMIDEFDGMVADIEPFWSLSSEELRRRTQQVWYIHVIPKASYA